MNGLLLAIPGAAILWLWLSGKKKQDAPVAPPKRYRVIGDSHAVGIKAGLAKVGQKLPIEGTPVVGASTNAMPTAFDYDAFTIVSAGTNDAAGNAYPSDIVTRVERVLGPYAKGTATEGRLVYVLPHDKMGEPLKTKVSNLRKLLKERLVENDRFKILDIDPDPDAPDKIHFSPMQYGAIASAALGKWPLQ